MLERGIQFLNKRPQFKNLSIYGIGQVFNLVTPLLIAPYLISVCGIEGFGKIGTGFALAFFLIVFVDYGSDIIGVREVSINRSNSDSLKNIFVSTYLTKFLMLFSVLVIMTILIKIIPYFRNEQTLYFLSLSILVGQFLNPIWFLQGQENYKWVTYLNIISKLFYVVFIFVLVKDTNDYIFANLCFGAGMILAGIIGFIKVIFDLKLKTKDFLRVSVTQNFKKGFSIFSSQLFVSLQIYLPVIIISYVGGNVLAGYYRIVEQIIVMFKTYIFLFFNFLFPRVSLLLNENKKEAFRFWKNYNLMNLALVTVMMIVVFVLAQYIVLYFSEEGVAEITGYLRVAVFIPILLVIQTSLKQIILGSEKNVIYTRITIFWVLIQLAMIFALTSIYGILGVILIMIFIEIMTILCFGMVISNNKLLKE